MTNTSRKCTGYRIGCRRCAPDAPHGLVSFASHDDAHATWNNPEVPSRYYCFLPCRGCGRWLPAQTVVGQAGKRRCGPWCTEGYGLKCTCECAGANHGRDLPVSPGMLAWERN